MSIEILTRNESVKYLGQRISFHHQETMEIKNRLRAAWATFRKYRQEFTSKNCMLRFNRRSARCYDSLIIQTKRKYKKIEKQDIGTNEEIEEIDINEMCSTDDESGGGLSTTTHNDVDSDVSFEDDADEEIDTTSIEEEEDWIEYIKRSTDEAIEKMESAKIRCWNKTHKK